MLLKSLVLNRICIGALEYDFVELLYYSSQIVSAFFVISGGVIVIRQYYLPCNESKRDI